MSIRNIIIEPDDPILRKKVQLETVDDSTRKLLDDMMHTMYNAPGIGSLLFDRYFKTHCSY